MPPLPTAFACIALHILKKLNAKLFARLHFHLHLHFSVFNAAAAEVAYNNSRNIF